MAKSRPIEGTVIVTDFQTQGKGQYGNVWESEPAQNFLGSVLLCPHFLLAEEAFYVNMAVCLAIAKTTRQYMPDFSEDVQIKWPNDLLVHKKKIAGVLIENQLRDRFVMSSIVGIGININQTSFSERYNATSIKNIVQETISIRSFANDLFSNIEAEYLLLKSRSFSTIKTRYMQLLYGTQSLISLQDKNGSFRAKVIDIEKSGQLTLQKESGENETYSLKEISFLLN